MGRGTVVDDEVPDDLVASVDPMPVGERLVRLNRSFLEIALPGVLRPRTVARNLDLADDPTVVVRRPPGGAVLAATLVTVDDPDVDGTVRDTDVVATTGGGDHVGSEVDPSGWVAAAVRPATAVSATGVEVRLLGTAATTEVLARCARTTPACRPHGCSPVAPRRGGRAPGLGAGRVPPVGAARHPGPLGRRPHRCRAGGVAGPSRAGARWAGSADGAAWEAWSTDGDDTLGARLRFATGVAADTTEPALVVPVDGVDLPVVAGGSPGTRDLDVAMGPGPAAMAEVLVVAPRGTGRVRLEPPVVVEPS